MRIHCCLALSFMFSCVAFASSEPKKADAHGGGHAEEKKADPHGGGHGDAPAEPQLPQGPKREYNPGKVTKFPGFKADLVGSGESIEFKPEKGRAAVIIFVASWCDPCQVLMGEFNQLARKYAANNTDIYFVFAHDTKEDAAGFLNEHKTTAKAVMANNDLLKAFKNPELPSIYLSDRWGLMVDRFIKTKKSDIEKIDVILGKITAL